MSMVSFLSCECSDQPEASEGMYFSLVMAGLVPAIHVLPCCDTKEDVDARHEAGHDGN
jgi:hypothetical protein